MERLVKHHHQPGTGGWKRLLGFAGVYAWPTQADVSRRIGGSSLRMTICVRKAGKSFIETLPKACKSVNTQKKNTTPE